MNPRRAFHDQGERGRIVADRVPKRGVYAFPTWIIVLLGRIDRSLALLSTLDGIQGRPFLGVADNVPDETNQQDALVATLQAELAAEVSELTKLAAAEPQLAAAESEVVSAAARSRESKAATEAGTLDSTAGQAAETAAKTAETAAKAEAANTQAAETAAKAEAANTQAARNLTAEAA